MSIALLFWIYIGVWKKYKLRLLENSTLQLWHLRSYDEHLNATRSRIYSSLSCELRAFGESLNASWALLGCWSGPNRHEPRYYNTSMTWAQKRTREEEVEEIATESKSRDKNYFPLPPWAAWTFLCWLEARLKCDYWKRHRNIELKQRGSFWRSSASALPFLLCCWSALA